MVSQLINGMGLNNAFHFSQQVVKPYLPFTNVFIVFYYNIKPLQHLIDFPFSHLKFFKIKYLYLFIFHVLLEFSFFQY